MHNRLSNQPDTVPCVLVNDVAFIGIADDAPFEYQVLVEDGRLSELCLIRVGRCGIADLLTVEVEGDVILSERLCEHDILTGVLIRFQSEQPGDVFARKHGRRDRVNKTAADAQTHTERIRTVCYGADCTDGQIVIGGELTAVRDAAGRLSCWDVVNGDLRPAVGRCAVKSFFGKIDDLKSLQTVFVRKSGGAAVGVIEIVPRVGENLVKIPVLALGLGIRFGRGFRFGSGFRFGRGLGFGCGFGVRFCGGLRFRNGFGYRFGRYLRVSRGFGRRFGRNLRVSCGLGDGFLRRIRFGIGGGFRLAFLRCFGFFRFLRVGFRTRLGFFRLTAVAGCKRCGQTQNHQQGKKQCNDLFHGFPPIEIELRSVFFVNTDEQPCTHYK